jgi:hypothetical protein
MTHSIISTPKQGDFLAVPLAPVMYRIVGNLVEIYETCGKASDYVNVPRGMSTGSNDRFVRCFWEVPENTRRWITFGRAGRVKKWWGLRYAMIDWPSGEMKMQMLPGARIQNKSYYDKNGATFSQAGRGSLGVRLMGSPMPFEAKAPGIFVKGDTDNLIAYIAYFNTRIASWLVRAFSPAIDINENTVASLPVPGKATQKLLRDLGRCCIEYSKALATLDNTEDTYQPRPHGCQLEGVYATLLNTTEAVVDNVTFTGIGLVDSIDEVLAETGTPAGWHPLISGYDDLPALPDGLDLPPLPQEVHAYLAAHERRSPDAGELARIKANLRALYEAGPGAKDVLLEDDSPGDDDEPLDRWSGDGYLPP